MSALAGNAYYGADTAGGYPNTTATPTSSVGSTGEKRSRMAQEDLSGEDSRERSSGGRTGGPGLLAHRVVETDNP